MIFRQNKETRTFHQFWKSISKVKSKRIITSLLAFVFILLINTHTAMAEPETSVLQDVLSGGSGTTDVVKILVILTILTILPSIIMTVTAFPRIIIVLSFTRNAMGTQQMPPNQILIGIALVLTFFIMNPVFADIKTEAYDPYMAGEIETQEAYNAAMEPIREFMFKHAKTEPDSIDFFLGLYGAEEKPGSLDDIPSVVLMMAFITSELKKAFIIGFLLYIPFLVIDMIVSSVLMAMGMMMMPPAMISLPFKVLLFILIDGWTLLFKTIVLSFG